MLFVFISRFFPEHKTRNAITNIYKKKFERSWRSWGEVDKDTKEMWFEEFKACDNLYNIYL